MSDVLSEYRGAPGGVKLCPQDVRNDLFSAETKAGIVRVLCQHDRTRQLLSDELPLKVVCVDCGHVVDAKTLARVRQKTGIFGELNGRTYVTAVYFDGTNSEEVKSFCAWVINSQGGTLVVNSPDGLYVIRPGDYVVRLGGVNYFAIGGELFDLMFVPLDLQV